MCQTLKEVQGIKEDRLLKAVSPSASEWARQIPELENVNGLNTWAAICDHLGVLHQARSARIEMKAWVQKTRLIGSLCQMLDGYVILSSK